LAGLAAYFIHPTNNKAEAFQASTTLLKGLCFVIGDSVIGPACPALLAQQGL